VDRRVQVSFLKYRDPESKVGMGVAAYRKVGRVVVAIVCASDA
jgi:hypothetical protein